MARGALQYMSLPHTTDTSSDYSYMRYYTVCNINYVHLWTFYLCAGSIQVKIFQICHTELCNQLKATLCCHCGRTDQGTINYISPGDALCT